MAITRSKPQLPPFTRLVHAGIAISFLVALGAAGRNLGWHAGAGYTLGALSLIWILLAGFGLTRKRGARPRLPTRLLWWLLLALLLLTVAAGIVSYAAVYGGGAAAGLAALSPELARLAVAAHRPLALAALIAAAVHAFGAGFARYRERRQRLRPESG